jgi:hypothetical protein
MGHVISGVAHISDPTIGCRDGKRRVDKPQQQDGEYTQDQQGKKEFKSPTQDYTVSPFFLFTRQSVTALRDL